MFLVCWAFPFTSTRWWLLWPLYVPYTMCMPPATYVLRYVLSICPSFSSFFALMVLHQTRPKPTRHMRERTSTRERGFMCFLVSHCVFLHLGLFASCIIPVMCLVCRARFVQISQCDVYRLEDSSEVGGFRYLLVEPFLEGKYAKVRGERSGGGGGDFGDNGNGRGGGVG